MKKNSAFILILLFFTAAYLVPGFTFANGGDQRVVENKYLINLSRAPFTPRVGVKTSFLASFVDIQKNKLISEDLVVRIRISKLGDAPKGKFIFEQDNIAVKGGVLELAYTFQEAGLHEIFFDFAFASNHQEFYEAPDFLIDIQDPTEKTQLPSSMVIGIMAGAVGGLIVGLFIRRIKSSSH